MYKQYSLENNVTAFSITNLFLQKLIGSKLFLDDKLIETNTNCLGYFIDENQFCYSNDNDFHLSVLNITNNFQIDIGPTNLQSFKIGDLFLSYDFDEDFNSEIVWIDKSFNEKIRTRIYNITFSYFFNKYGFHKTNKLLSIYKLPDCKLLWTTNVNILAIIGVYNNILWLHVEHSRLIGLDVKTGELKYQIDLLKEFNFKSNAIDQFVCGDIHLDPSIGVLKSLSNRYYWELDLNTLKVLMKNDFGADQTISWRIQRSRFYEGDKNLYFIGAKNGEGVNRGVGIFDTEKCDVLWYDQPLEEKKFLFFTDAPQANQTQLGVIDSDNTLRIYNKI